MSTQTANLPVPPATLNVVDKVVGFFNPAAAARRFHPRMLTAAPCGFAGAARRPRGTWPGMSIGLTRVPQSSSA